MNALEFYRKRAGLTQEAVAERLKINRSAVAKWETGKAFPSSKRLPEIAALYCCTVDELIKLLPKSETTNGENIA
jgi:transcriptional regulator with XRE-family HTH domain